MELVDGVRVLSALKNSFALMWSLDYNLVDQNLFWNFHRENITEWHPQICSPPSRYNLSLLHVYTTLEEFVLLALQSHFCVCLS